MRDAVLTQAVEQKIDEQAAFVPWWAEKLRGPGKVNSRREEGIGLTEAEELTGITIQQMKRPKPLICRAPAKSGPRFRRGCDCLGSGDRLNYGELTYGETYAQAMEETGFDYQTCRNAKGLRKQRQVAA